MMRNFFFLMLVLVFSSCSNVVQYKEAIETVNNEWEMATSKITGVVEQTTQMQKAATTTLNALSPSEEIAEQMSEAQTATLNSLMQQVQAQVGSLGDLSKTVFEFVNKWQQGSESLSSLKDGISNGKLPENTEASIQELKKLITTGNANVEDWEQQLSAAKEVINNATQGYTSLMESFSTAAAE